MQNLLKKFQKKQINHAAYSRPLIFVTYCTIKDFFLFKKKEKNGWTVVGINVGAAPWVDVIAGLEVLLGNPVGEDAHLMWLIDWYLIDWCRLLPQSTLSFPLSDKENGLVELFHFFRLLNEEGWISDAGMLLNSLLVCLRFPSKPYF